MKEFSLILNTGIQIHELDQEITIDLSGRGESAADNVKLWFYEMQIPMPNGQDDVIDMDVLYKVGDTDKFLRRQHLVANNYLDPVTNQMAPASIINKNMQWVSMTDEHIVKVSSPDVSVGRERETAIKLISDKWLPIPMYEQSNLGSIAAPSNWCRIKLVPVKEKSTASKQVFRVLMAFDTDENKQNPTSGPLFNGQPYKQYSLCGISAASVDSASTEAEKKILEQMTIPLKAWEFCNSQRNPWLDSYLRSVFDSETPEKFQLGQKTKYIAYYAYIVTYLHMLRAIPDVRLYNDKGVGTEVINVNMVLDVGNSRTFGLLAEDPLSHSFSQSTVLELRDLSTGEVYDNPFDMRLCFKQERFGYSSSDGEFRWPSLVRLGKEAARDIYGGEQDLESGERFDTSHSSPKRYLWDNKPFKGVWKFISERDRFVGPSQTVFMEGIGQQLTTTGEFTGDPDKFGNRPSYSRRSLMTLCFMEILLQARMQINGVAFRHKNGNESRKREISRVIITCPTAMPRKEQIALRRCMEEAAKILERYYAGTYNEAIKEDVFGNQAKQNIEVIPSVRDLQLSATDADMRRYWNFDEATCCQMVYMYSELRRYLGNVDEFFGLYGKRRVRDDERDEKPSLTVASIDIGAGTTDIMICNYQNLAGAVCPTPLFYESFHTAGDELVKKVINDVMLDNPRKEYPGASGIISAKLQEIGCRDVANAKHSFFGDGQSMGVTEQRMRKEFCVQVLIPIANFLLDKLQKNEPERQYTFGEIFSDVKPAKKLLNFFYKQMGFRIEDVKITFSPKFMNEIVCKVFEPSFRKWAAIFYAYDCDIVLMAGRPCSLKQINRLLRRLYSVAPNRLISMNDYRVGSWYPGSTNVGHFGDKKSMVAVGALISYLAEMGKLNEFKLTTNLLKKNIKPTTEYIGKLNSHIGTLEKMISPDMNRAQVEVSALPVQFGTKQLDVAGYPAQLLYVLDFNDDYIREQAIAQILNRGTGARVPDDITPNDLSAEMESIRFMVRRSVPLRFRLEREYREDKELVKIESVTNFERDDVNPQLFNLQQQSWAEDESNWLDSGVFIMRIND